MNDWKCIIFMSYFEELGNLYLKVKAQNYPDICIHIHLHCLYNFLYDKFVDGHIHLHQYNLILLYQAGNL